MPSLPARIVERIAGRLRFPILFLVTAGLFLADLAVPDAIPFIDEIVLGLLTVLLGSWRNRRRRGDERENVESSGSGA